MKKTIMHRQGDLLFTALEELPKGLTRHSSQVIVAGEVTGHSHRLLEGRVLSDDDGRLFLQVLHATSIVHEEHRAIHLEPGCYAVVRQSEYTPGAIEEVRD